MSVRVNPTHIFIREAALLERFLFLFSGIKLMRSHNLFTSTDIKQIVYLCNLSEGVKFINNYIIHAHCRGHKVPYKFE